MYTIPPYLPHEEKTGLFSLPRRSRGIAALVAIGLIGWLSGGAPSMTPLILITAAGLLAGAELLPAQLWLARGWLRAASILTVAIVIGIVLAQFGSRPKNKLSTLCGCSYSQRSVPPAAQATSLARS